MRGREQMSGAVDHDPVGAFGNPDGSRADLDVILRDFVDFGPRSGFGALATRASDAHARVIVGCLGAGKTVHMRRLQSFQAQQDSVYAGLPQQDALATEEVVKVCQWFAGRDLDEKWILLWNRATLRSVASHILRHRELKNYVQADERDEIEREYGHLLGDYRRPGPYTTNFAISSAPITRSTS
ncbi:MAG: hypothetical protein S0880_17905 [Actinomycetota bacterium]|nr:hypothetical protein [Actinomycetota bacterium]